MQKGIDKVGDAETMLKGICEEKHKAIEQYLKNDKENIQQLIKNQTELAVIQAKQSQTSEQITNMFAEFKEEAKFYRDTIMQLLSEKQNKKITFWETTNGKKLFNALLLIGVAIIVAALGLNLTQYMNLIK